ncbi:hypothetical protein D3C72_1580880 [compost metagenome]
MVDVAAIDLIQRGKAATAFGVAIVGPVFLGVSRVDRGQARAIASGRDSGMGDEHIARGNHQYDGQYARYAVGATAGCGASGAR